MGDPLIYHTPHLYRIYMIEDTRDRSLNVSNIDLRVMFAVNIYERNNENT